MKGALARAVLVAATLVLAASMGGAMLPAAPVLVPLHWRAARGRGPVAVGGWAVLASLSTFEAGWMATYLVVGDGGLSMAIGVMATAAVATLFLRRAAEISACQPPPAASQSPQHHTR